MAQKAPQATFSNELGDGLHLLHFLEQTFEQGAGQVAFAGVRKNHDDGLARVRRLARQPQRRHHRGTAGYAAEYPFLARQLARGRNRFLVADLLHAVDQRQIQVLRNEPGADALNLVRRRDQRLTRRVWLMTGEWVGSTATLRIFFDRVCLM